MRSVTLTPPSKPDGAIPPLREAQGDASKRSELAGDARSRSERTILLSGRRLSVTPSGRGYRDSSRSNRAMTDGAPYNRLPEGRRSGDVGDAGTLLTDAPTIFRPR